MPASTSGQGFWRTTGFRILAPFFAMQMGLFFYTNSLQGISRRDRSDHDGDALVSSLLVRLIIVYIILSVLCYWYSIMAILVNFRSSFKLLVLVPLSLIHVSYTLDKGVSLAHHGELNHLLFWTLLGPCLFLHMCYLGSKRVFRKKRERRGFWCLAVFSVVVYSWYKVYKGEEEWKQGIVPSSSLLLSTNLAPHCSLPHPGLAWQDITHGYLYNLQDLETCAASTFLPIADIIPTPPPAPATPAAATSASFVDSLASLSNQVSLPKLPKIYEMRVPAVVGWENSEVLDKINTLKASMHSARASANTRGRQAGDLGAGSGGEGEGGGEPDADAVMHSTGAYSIVDDAVRDTFYLQCPGKQGVRRAHFELFPSAHEMMRKQLLTTGASKHTRIKSDRMFQKAVMDETLQYSYPFTAPSLPSFHHSVYQARSDEKTDDSGFFFNFPRHVAKANGVRGMEVSDDEYEYYDDDSYGDASAAAGVRAGEGEGEGAGEGAGEGEGEAALKVEVKDIYTMMGLTPPSSEDTQQKQTGGEEREENDRRQGGRRRRRGNSNSKSKSDDNAGGGGGGGDADREDPLAESHMTRDNMLKVTLGESVKAETIIAGCFYDPEGDMSDEWKDLSARYEHAKQTADAYYTNAKSHIGDTLSDTYQKIKPYLPAPGMGGGAGADSGGGVGTGEGELAGEEEGADGAGGKARNDGGRSGAGAGAKEVFHAAGRGVGEEEEEEEEAAGGRKRKAANENTKHRGETVIKPGSWTVLVRCIKDKQRVSEVNQYWENRARSYKSTFTPANLLSSAEFLSRATKPASYNVLQIVLDSVSRRHFRRHFPQTIAWMRKSYSEDEIIEMFRYHSTEKYSMQSLFVEKRTRAGKDRQGSTGGRDSARSGDRVSSHSSTQDGSGAEARAGMEAGAEEELTFDDMYLSWKAFHEGGFITASVDNSGCKQGGMKYGSELANIDHQFIGPYCHPEYTKFDSRSSFWQGPHSIRRRCLGDRQVHDVQFDYMTQFWQTYQPYPKVLRAVFIEGHEPTGEVVAMLDPSLMQFLSNLKTKGALDSTIVMFVADHGLGMGVHYAMKVPMALQEHKLPLLTMLLPASLKRRYSALHANLKQNQQKLVSIADVRATLRHIATMNRPDNVGSGMRNLDAFRDSEKEHQISRLSPKNADDDMSNGSNGSGRDSGDSGRVVKSYSLFDVIPAGRSCEDVGIERIHCLCMDNDPFLN